MHRLTCHVTHILSGSVLRPHPLCLSWALRSCRLWGPFPRPHAEGHQGQSGSSSPVLRFLETLPGLPILDGGFWPPCRRAHVRLPTALSPRPRHVQHLPGAAGSTSAGVRTGVPPSLYFLGGEATEERQELCKPGPAKGKGRGAGDLSVCVCVHLDVCFGVFVYVRMRLCVSACVCVCLCVSNRAYVFVCVCMYLCVFACSCVCVCICLRVCLSVCSDVCLCV